MESPQHVLVIEDDEVDAEAVVRLLDGAHWHDNVFTVTHAPTLDDGIELLATRSFQLILLDLGLPDEHGLRALTHLRNVSNLPIVVLTGMSDQATAMESLRHGAQDFLEKRSISSPELLRCLSYAIERNRLDAELRAATNRLRMKKAVLQKVVDHMADGIVLTDESGSVILRNPAARRLLRAPGPDDTSEPVLMPSGADASLTLTDLLARALDHDQSPVREVVVQGQNGHSRSILSVQTNPIYDRDDRLSGCVTVFHDVTQSKELEALKDDFISVVSHELRTPLTSINGSLGLIATGTAGPVPDTMRVMVEVAQRNCERLVRLINDLLDFQKINAGKFSIEMERLDLVELVRQSLIANEGYASKHGVDFIFTGSDAPSYPISGNADRLHQVMTNLLSNAAKFSPRNSVVRVSIERTPDGACVAVSDEGVGIPLSEQQKLFTKFMQIDATLNRSVGGTGLGLSITKSLIEMHNGRIWSTSVEGEGSVFSFALPVLSEADAALEPCVAPARG